MALAGFVLGPAPAHAADITGVATVIDGDTIEVGHAIVRLSDIDAPELGQQCDGGPKEMRRCGEVAAAVLADRIEGATVDCETIDVDPYGRHVASCSHAGEDLSAWLVRSGYALAFRRYSVRLVDAEEGGSSRRPRSLAGHRGTALGVPGATLVR